MEIGRKWEMAGCGSSTFHSWLYHHELKSHFARNIVKLRVDKSVKWGCSVMMAQSAAKFHGLLMLLWLIRSLPESFASLIYSRFLSFQLLKY